MLIEVGAIAPSEVLIEECAIAGSKRKMYPVHEIRLQSQFKPLRANDRYQKIRPMTLIVGDELLDYAKSITDRSEFEYFLRCWVADYRINYRQWENLDLLSYLQGLSEFVPDIDGYYANAGEEVDTEQPSWRLIAEMLIAASVYGNY